MRAWDVSFSLTGPHRWRRSSACALAVMGTMVDRRGVTVPVVDSLAAEGCVAVELQAKEGQVLLNGWYVYTCAAC